MADTPAPVQAAGNAITKGAGFAARNAGKALILSAVFVGVAALVGPGITAMAGKSTVGFKEIGGAMLEGLTEGTGKVSEFAQLSSKKLAEWMPTPSV